MIGYLSGEILDHSEGKLLLGVGSHEAGGRVGYAVSVPQSAIYHAFQLGQRIELYVYTHIREEAFDLYGFHSKFEKEVFLTLLTVNGIGPKGALGILTKIEPARLLEAILEGDQAFLTRIPGIGKKTAERVVVELRDGIKKKVDTGVFSINATGPTSGKSDGPMLPKRSAVPGMEDAKLALLTLGYREQEIQIILNKVLESSPSPITRAEDLIRSALQHL